VVIMQFVHAVLNELHDHEREAENWTPSGRPVTHTSGLTYGFHRTHPVEAGPRTVRYMTRNHLPGGALLDDIGRPIHAPGHACWTATATHPEISIGRPDLVSQANGA
jgi:hypothetical protein